MSTNDSNEFKCPICYDQPAPVQSIEHCIWARNGNTPCPHTTLPATQPVKSFNKKIKDGKVAILYSPRHGAGWYSWHRVEELLYDPKVVDMVEAKTSARTIELYCEEVYDNKGHYYYGGAYQLEVRWLPIGTQFRIQEYDGAETIEINSEVNWFVS
jgi:hypothetical protein